MPAEKTSNKNIGIVLLAAGNSSRLGRPKQLLPYENKTLLNHCLQVADTTSEDPVVLVLGAQAETIRKEISDFDPHVVINTDWAEGMASSIRCGIRELVRINPAAKGAVLMVCDQPFITSALINSLLAAHQKTGKRIVACSYAETFGPPVLFHNSLFPELLQLTGDVGARSIIQHHADDVEMIPFPGGTYDVDTREDYEKIKSVGNQ